MKKNQVGYFFRLATLLTSLLASTLLVSDVSALPEKPNVILILGDDMGIDSVSAFNEKMGLKTPSIDLLASQGMSFMDAHSTSGVCSPTRYSVLTGRYNWRSRLKRGIVGQWERPLIADVRQTLPEMFRENDYATCMIGKWHLGWHWPKKAGGFTEKLAEIDFTKAIKGGPNSHGFDYYFGDDVPNWPPYAWRENEHLIGNLTSQMKRGTMVGVSAGPAIANWDFSKVLLEYGRRCAEYVRGRKGKQQPFFLYFPMPSPHTPIAPGGKFKGISKITPYADFIVETDWAVGEILKSLEDTGQAENTVVIFTCDNGTSPRAEFAQLEVNNVRLNENWRGWKADVYEGGHRVPFIVRWPDQIKKGMRSEQTISLTDIMATCANIIGSKLPANTAEDSVSLMPVLTGKKMDGPLHDLVIHHSISGHFAVRMGKWKLLLCRGSGGWSPPRENEATKKKLPMLQLYDLENDPKETENLHDKYPDRVEKLVNALAKAISEGRTTPGPQQANQGWPNTIPQPVLKKFPQLAALPKKADVLKPDPPKPISAPSSRWPGLIAAVDPGSRDKTWTKTRFDHSKWKTMKLPGHFDTVELPGFDGVVWFRKTIELSAEQAKSKAILHLGQIDDMDVTWVNGTRVGGYENPGHHYTVRNYPVPAGLLKTGKNTIAVRVMDHGAPGGISGKPEQLFLKLGKETVPLANLWHYAPGANLNALNKHAALIEPKPATPVHALLRPLTRPAKPVPAFTKGFKVTGDQTIIILGGTNAAESSRYGWIETILSAKHPKHQLNVRNMAWPADTVYQQQRPRNFFSASKPSYGEADHRPAITADTIFLWFGKMESLETGSEKNPASFRTSYETILNQLANYTGRLILITPPPFEDPLDIGLNSKELNTNLAEYVAAIHELADDRGLPVVDLFTELKGKPVTSDGQMLSTEGHRLGAEAIARQLGFSSQLSTGNDTLREAIVTKNALWRQYWLPTNWAFLYGNRQTQPSSRSHIRGTPRWFPEEVKKSLSDLEKMEKKIWKELPKSNTN